MSKTADIDMEIKAFLDEKVTQYNQPNFIETDPISVPHQFSLKEDIEIAGFLAATIAWGNRKMIIKNANRMVQLMGNSPYDFVMSHDNSQLKKLNGFVHRTFNSEDFKYFITALKHIYSNHKGLESVFSENATSTSLQPAIHEFKKMFFSISHPQRSQKHVSDPLKGSAAKRINMFLRWMVRNDKSGVDFGLWKIHSSSCTLLPVRCSLWKCSS